MSICMYICTYLQTLPQKSWLEAVLKPPAISPPLSLNRRPYLQRHPTDRRWGPVFHLRPPLITKRSRPIMRRRGQGQRSNCSMGRLSKGWVGRGRAITSACFVTSSAPPPFRRIRDSTTTVILLVFLLFFFFFSTWILVNIYVFFCLFSAIIFSAFLVVWSFYLKKNLVVFFQVEVFGCFVYIYF